MQVFALFSCIYAKFVVPLYPILQSGDSKIVKTIINNQFFRLTKE